MVHPVASGGMSPSSTGAKNEVAVEVEGRQLKLSNLDKVLYPEAGFTKGQVIDYYTRIAPVLVPHLQGRPVTLKRYPNGVASQFFYEKNCPKHRPPWVATTPVYAGRKNELMDYCVVNDLPTLVWMANLAALELHPSLSRAPEITAADDDGLRPRPGAAGRPPRVLPGGPPAPGASWRGSASRRSPRRRGRRVCRSTSP